MEVDIGPEVVVVVLVGAVVVDLTDVVVTVVLAVVVVVMVVAPPDPVPIGPQWVSGTGHHRCFFMARHNIPGKH